jgi:soluble lytic murein transglycosylase
VNYSIDLDIRPELQGDMVGFQDLVGELLKAGNKTKSKDTSLFWLGYLQKNSKLRKVYWDHLITEYPLNFHSIHASKIMKIDPYSDFLKKPFIYPQRKTQDSLAQTAIYWLESLYLFGEKKAATSLSIKISSKLQDHFSKANLLYAAALADKYNFPSDAVRISSFFISEHPKILNLQTLRFLHPRPFEKTFDRIEINVDPLMTLSVAKQESGFNPLARSPANARGFLQILPSTAASYNVKSESYLYDLETNIAVGGKILSDLMKKQGRMDFALAAYNAGPNKVEEWKKRYDNEDPMLFIDLIPYNETRNYVANVLRNHYWYSALYERNVASR